jgi:2-polyprenyl-3-methyl-5-hydroxy-6-metoxy-1,4-benzoquinol methylase
MRILKPTLKVMQKVTSMEIPGISNRQKDTMAIPSFLHWNPVIRRIVWQRYEVIAEYAEFSKSDTVLEFGCGPGFFLPELNRHGCKIIAVDLFPQYAEQLCKELGIKAIFSKSLDTILDNSVSILIASEVFEHLESLYYYVCEVKRIIKPNGKLLLSLPTENILYKAGRFFAGFHGKADYHVSDMNYILKVFTDAGFRTIHKTAIPLRLLSLYQVHKLEAGRE